MGAFRVFGFRRAIAAALYAIHQEIINVNATVDEIKQDISDVSAALKAEKTKTDALIALANSLKAQLDTLIIAGSPSVTDLNALRDGLISAKAQILQESDAIDAAVAADTPTPDTPPAG